jgi:hypothetical protein
LSDDKQQKDGKDKLPDDSLEEQLKGSEEHMRTGGPDVQQPERAKVDEAMRKGRKPHP